MRKDRNAMYPTYPMPIMQGGYPGMPVMPMQSNMPGCMNDNSMNNIESQINNLEKRVTTLENMINTNKNYNTSTYQMM